MSEPPPAPGDSQERVVDEIVASIDPSLYAAVILRLMALSEAAEVEAGDEQPPCASEAGGSAGATAAVRTKQQSWSKKLNCITNGREDLDEMAAKNEPSSSLTLEKPPLLAPTERAPATSPRKQSYLVPAPLPPHFGESALASSLRQAPGFNPSMLGGLYQGADASVAGITHRSRRSVSEQNQRFADPNSLLSSSDRAAGATATAAEGGGLGRRRSATTQGLSRDSPRDSSGQQQPGQPVTPRTPGGGGGRSRGPDFNVFNKSGCAIIGFESDSPSFREKVEALHDNVAGLRAHLERLVEITRKQGRTGTKYGALGRQQAREMMDPGGWFSGLGDLAPLLVRFGRTMDEIQSYRDMLSTAMENVFAAPLEAFAKRETKESQAIRKAVERSREKYEETLSKYLRLRPDRDRALAAEKEAELAACKVGLY
jgi:hypothetical protein